MRSIFANTHGIKNRMTPTVSLLSEPSSGDVVQMQRRIIRNILQFFLTNRCVKNTVNICLSLRTRISMGSVGLSDP